MVKCSTRLWVLIPVLLAAVRADAQVLNLYDRWGVYAGSIPSGSTALKTHLVTAYRPLDVIHGDRWERLAAGIYFALPANGRLPAPAAASNGSLGFVDVSAGFLPPGEWDARDIQAADFNGDSREDIVFTLNRTYCDSLGDKRPRLLIRNEEGRYVDETGTRIPPGRYAADQAVVLDADGDHDNDLFLTGYGCMDSDPRATLLINDGAGNFTDESAARLPASGLIYSAAAGTLDGNDSPDLLVIDWNLSGPFGIRPVVWLNDGSGMFRADTAGRFVPGDYGYFVPATADISGDLKADLVFANLGLCVTTPENPDCIDTLSGGVAIYVNQGDGFFADETATRLPPLDTLDFRKVEPLDADDDGDLDLLLLSLFDQPLCRLLVNDGAGKFPPAAPMATDTIAGIALDAAAGRLDADPYPDLILARVYFNGVPGKDVLLVNTGAGAWTDSSPLLPDSLDFSISAALIDHDLDDDRDFLTANDTGIRLYRNLLNDVAGVTGAPDGVPAVVSLLPNYPNPFNPVTTISYILTAAGPVKLAVHDLLGEEVAVLVEGVQRAGHQSVTFDASGLASGVYSYRLTTATGTEVRMMVLIE